MQAVRDSFEAGEVLTYAEVFERVKAKGDWTDDNIDQNLMAPLVNLAPAARHWGGDRFLFVHPDGRFELYNKNKHPIPVE